MNEFYRYLMLEMASEINNEWEESSQKAHELCFLLSLDGHEIPETFFRLYACGVDVQEEVIVNALSFFTGMGLIKVNCDCSDEWQSSCEINSISESHFYEAGKSCVSNKEEVWTNLVDRVTSMRSDFGVGEAI